MGKKNILVIHGFMGNANCNVATVLGEYLQKDFNIDAPEIPMYGDEAQRFISNTLKKKHYDIVVGTSLGAFYNLNEISLASEPAKILINPCINGELDLIEVVKHKYGSYSPEQSYKFDFIHKRQNGDKIFCADKRFFEELKAIRLKYESLPKDRESVNARYKNGIFAIISLDDENFCYYDEMCELIGEENTILLENEKHSLTNKALKNIVVPLIYKIVGHN